MKKKIFIIALAACLAVLSVAGSSIAYFTDEDKITNTFTVGNVDIRITEAEVTVDANKANIIKADPGERQISTGIDYKQIRNLYPGQSVYKDPRIENIGSEAAYVGAIITITDIQSLLPDENARKAFISGGSLENADNKIKWVVSDEDLKIYVIVAEALDAKNGNADADFVELFNNVTIAAGWNNAQMALLADMQITVEAYATQTQGFAVANDAVYAIKTAFPDQFGDITFN